ncbi:hypothetical protein [Burkholderia cepacia]|uniref:hypothetical protein n=1 Tax=Burkholderia cepacia TaxID=292 RepID=UPI00177ACBD8|nr:hypothetical protein [Burkholderia cepacia]
MKTFARSERSGRSVGSFIVLQGEFWPNGIYAGISEVAYAMQDLSVNRVGIFRQGELKASIAKASADAGSAEMDPMAPVQ